MTGPGPGLERTVQRSLLDRLVDTEPGVPRDPPQSFTQSLRTFRESVRRDVEWLLNTRRPPPDLGPRGELAEQSVLAFGLPDVTSLSADSAADRQQLLASVRDAIRAFEPRLDRVQVALVETEARGARELRLRIDGLLRMDPSPEAVTFDTVLDLTNREYRVRAAAGA